MLVCKAINLLDSCVPLGFCGDDSTFTSSKILARLVTPSRPPRSVSFSGARLISDCLAVDMTHHVLAVVNAESEAELTHVNILGFVVVLKVETAKNRIKLLSPSDLPTKYLIYSSSIVYNHAAI